MSGRTPRTATTVVTTLAVVLFAGCVHIPTPTFPSLEPGAGDTATFVVDGNTFSVTQSGTITVSGTGTALDYSGPLGCEGMYFETDYTDNASLDFRYGPTGADMLIGSDLYHFDGPPTEGASNLFWHQSFGDRDIAVTVNCTLPDESSPGASPPGGTTGTSAPASPTAS